MSRRFLITILCVALLGAGVGALGAERRRDAGPRPASPAPSRLPAPSSEPPAVPSYADGFIAAQRRTNHCRGRAERIVRSGPNKYAIGRCSTGGAEPSGHPVPRTRLLKEHAFASLIADNTCLTARCAEQAAARRATWVIVAGRTGAHPRTTRSCRRYKNIHFSGERAIEADRLPDAIPAGRKVLWRYATRGGRWVMARWGRGPFAWAFIPRSCVADPPTWSEIGLWPDADRARGVSRPTSGRPFRVLRPALPCASRQRCEAVKP